MPETDGHVQLAVPPEPLIDTRMSRLVNSEQPGIGTKPRSMPGSGVKPNTRIARLNVGCRLPVVATQLWPMRGEVFDTSVGVPNVPKHPLPNVPAFVMWDTDAVPQGYQYAGVHLYLGLYQFSATFVGVTQAAGDGSGFASLPIALPNNQTLRGFRFYAQWLLADPAAPSGVVTSDATELLLH